MTDVAELGFKIDSRELRQSERDLENFGKAGDRAGQKTERFGMASKKAFAMVAAASAAAAVAVGAMFSGSIREAEKFETAMLSMEAIIKATGGAAGRSADQLREQARGIARATLESTEGIMRAQQTMLTFRNIQGDVFDRAIQSATDMAAALGGDLNAATLQLSKALENPVEGLTALTRSGTVFTTAQKEMVKGMVEAGNTAEAQAFILSELEAQYGGTAEAAAGGLAGAQDTLGQSFQELKLSIADSLNLLERAKGANLALASAVDFLAENFDSIKGYVSAAAIGITALYLPAIASAVASTGLWIASLVTLKGALIATGLGAFVVVVGTAINVMTDLIEKTGSVGGALEAVKEISTEVWSRVGTGVEGASLKVQGSFALIKSYALERLADIIESLPEFANKMIGSFVGAYDAVVAAWGALPAALKAIIGNAMNGVISDVESGVAGMVNALNSIPGIEIAPPDLSGFMVEVEKAESVAGAAGAAFSAAFDRDYAGEMTSGLREASQEAENFGKVANVVGQSLTNSAFRPLESLAALNASLEDNADSGDAAAEAAADVAAALNGAGDVGGGGGGGAASGGVADSIAGAADNAMASMDRFREGTKTVFKDVLFEAKSFSEALSGVLNNLASKLFDTGFDSLFGIISGAMGFGGGSPAMQVALPNIMSGLPGYEGGGFTGFGARAGGMDGRGGFPAMLHPNETVIDHTKGGGGQNVHVTVSVDNNGNLRAFVDQRAQMAGQRAKNETLQAMPGAMREHDMRLG